MVKDNANSDDDITPPIILDQGNPASMHNLYRYVIQLSRAGNVATAEKECNRLAPYFDAFSRRLIPAVNGNDPERIEDFLQPESLSSIFMQVAVRLKNTVLSKVMILPDMTMQQEIIQKVGLRNIVCNKYQESKSSYNGSHYKFGFLQIWEKENGASGNIVSTIGVPVFSMNKKYLEAIEPCGGEELLGHLQNVMSWANHDMLHHYTSRLITKRIAKKFSDVTELHVMEWHGRYIENLKSSHSPLDYEAWAVQSHLRTWDYLKNEETGKSVVRSVDSFLDVLGAISGELQKREDLTPKQQHTIVDYFGMAMALAMTRLIPLKDHAFDNYFECLREIDPLPDALYVDLLKGKEATRAICEKINNDTHDGDNHFTGQLEFARMMLDSGNLKKDAFNKTLHSLSQMTYMTWEELEEMPDDEFLGTLKGELEDTKDGLLLERLDCDIHDFVVKAVRRDLPAYCESFAQMAKDYLPLLLEERKLKVMHNINKAENAAEQDPSAILFDYGFDEKIREDYSYIKKLQLANLVPSISYVHAKPEVGTRLYKAQKQLDQADIDMVRAITRDLGARPKPR